MAKGLNISITIPEELVRYYDKQAGELRTSRSKIILSVLLEDWKKNKKTFDTESTERNYED